MPSKARIAEAKVMHAADLLALTTREHASGKELRLNRKASRSSLFTRLRTTAPPTFRETVHPRRRRPDGPGQA
jgi:hypothetical protein